MEEIELPYPNKEFKMEEIWIDLSKQSIWKMKEIKIKAIQILGISNSLKFWNSWSKHKVNVKCCESLQSLPELPWLLKTLKAKHYKSLKDVLLFLSTTAEQLLENRKWVLFWNCLNLDEHSLVAIALSAQFNFMKFVNQHLCRPDHYHYNLISDVIHESFQGVYLYPGSSVPEWLEYKKIEDYIIIDLSSTLTSPMRGFIGEFLQRDIDMSMNIRLEVSITISDGAGEKDNFIMCTHDYFDSIIESDQVCVMSDQRCSSFLNSKAEN